MIEIRGIAKVKGCRCRKVDYCDRVESCFLPNGVAVVYVDSNIAAAVRSQHCNAGRDHLPSARKQ